jgi:serine/threonine protein kinase
MGVILYEFLVGSPPFIADTVEELFQQAINNLVEFPENDEEDDFYISPEAQDLILLLLEKDPARRLGTPPPPSHLASWEQIMPGAFYVKEHDFFNTGVPDEVDGIDWDNLLLEKANFVPALDDENDTSYFDARQR